MTAETDKYDKDSLTFALENHTCPNCAIDLRAFEEAIKKAERKKHEAEIKEMKLCFQNGMSKFCPTKGCTNSICPLNEATK